ncbi:MAG: hypothetical protein Ta2B_08660 [Termitinemataceae bacterium]|nr:MAG: hypothetical protein Ta2B_08660 [Termitinemataceae bacterium]
MNYLNVFKIKLWAPLILMRRNLAGRVDVKQGGSIYGTHALLHHLRLTLPRHARQGERIKIMKHFGLVIVPLSTISQI